MKKIFNYINSIHIYDDNTISYKRIKWHLIISTPLILLITTFLATRLAYSNDSDATKFKEVQVEYESTPIIIEPNNEFSEQKLWDMLNHLHVKYPHIVIAQSRIETGHYKSRIFIENHNLFGMKCSKTRATTHIGSQYNHALYESWQESVLDYAFYQTTFLRFKSEDEYLQYLSQHYAEAGKKYSELVKKESKKIIKKYETNKTN